MKRASLGCKVRSGRAPAVVIAAPDTLLDCRVLWLADPENPATFQPYHSGFGELEEDEARIAPRLRAVRRATRRSVKQVVAYWQRRGVRLGRATLVVGSLTDPQSIRQPHMRAHGLEGRLFRSVLSDAIKEHGIATAFVQERKLRERLGPDFANTLKRIKQQLSTLPDSTVSPWSTDNRLAVAAALAALSTRASVKT